MSLTTTPSEDAPRVRVERHGHVLHIGLDRAHKLNAFDRVMLRELAEAMTTYEEDADLRCALLYPVGPNFTSGLDLADVGPAVAAGEALFPHGLVDPFGLTGRARTKPLVHAARGWCLTIGTELALASDVCVASPGTRYGQIEVTRGIMPFGGATIRLPQVIGWHNAMRYLLTGDVFDAAEAHRVGLVQELTASDDDLVERAAALADRIASRAPLAVQASLASSRLAMLEGTKAAADAMVDAARGLMATEDAAEGMRSFVERRDAEFEGR